MDGMNRKAAKKGLITKTWEQCASMGGGGRKLMMKSKSWPRSGGERRRVAPDGCFSVYVGPQKQRFVIKTEYANHPLFKMLLEEAELEYGYNSAGPLVLPCKVDFFCEVLMEMEYSDEIRQGCSGFAKSHPSYRLLSPSRTLLAINKF
ncbi:hypothetical protein Acr_00g0031490 [Actinidia rufa]|uniref:SAUR-like auxin-responsive protein family n=1 Tax=Actinidia rufa TaxID=165716 RepID=A0A7J0DF54_9ERIC|nr:hypothetical protein Acr_00g0031490 [Actinidia rufa]